jgi:methionyl-tRNA formyltransferase
MGTPQYATVILEKLLDENFNVIGLFTQEDKKVGRKQIITAPHIKQYIIDNQLNIPIFQPKNLKENNTELIIKDLNPDIIIVAAYGQILPINILNLAPCINLHASLLPKYRGASPIQQSLLNNDEYTGVTAMMMEKGLDSGDILALKYLKIEDEMDVEYLFDKLSYIAADLTVDVVSNFNKILPSKQNESQVSFCGKIVKEDGLVTFNNAVELVSKYKAYKFWPGLFLENLMKLKSLQMNEKISQNKIGEILEINKDYIVIGCKVGSIQLYTVQLPSKKAISAIDFIRGSRLNIGDII